VPACLRSSAAAPGAVGSGRDGGGGSVDGPETVPSVVPRRGCGPRGLEPLEREPFEREPLERFGETGFFWDMKAFCLEGGRRPGFPGYVHSRLSLLELIEEGLHLVPQRRELFRGKVLFDLGKE